MHSVRAADLYFPINNPLTTRNKLKRWANIHQYVHLPFHFKPLPISVIMEYMVLLVVSTHTQYNRCHYFIPLGYETPDKEEEILISSYCIPNDSKSRND